MVDVIIHKIEPVRHEINYEGGSILPIKGWEVTATVYIGDNAIPSVEKGIYEFEKEEMPDRISEIEKRIESLYVGGDNE